MKRLILVSTMLVFAAVLSACSESAIQTDSTDEKSIIEKAEASETVIESANVEKPRENGEDGASSDDLMEQKDGTIQDGIYTNKDLGFSLNIPAHWLDHLAIESGYWAEEADHSIDFYYTADGDLKEYLFSIVVYNHEISESEWENEVWGYIGAANGRTYAHAISGEPSETILDEKNIEHFNAVQTLINEELLDVLNTFENIK